MVIDPNSVIFYLSGRIPSKKNSKYMIYAKGRPMFIPSPAYKSWHEEQSWQIKRRVPKEPYEDVTITLEFYAPDKRATDLSNKAESIMDLLVDSKVIKDDNWFVVPQLILRFVRVYKENPGVQITIEKNWQIRIKESREEA